MRNWKIKKTKFPSNTQILFLQIYQTTNDHPFRKIDDKEKKLV